MKWRIRKFFSDMKLKRKLIAVILFCLFLQNLIVLIASNKLLQQQEIKTAKQHVESECFLLQNQFETNYQNTIICSNEIIKNINQMWGNNSMKAADRNVLESLFRYNLHLFPFIDSIIFLDREGEAVYAGTEQPPASDVIQRKLLDEYPESGNVKNDFKEIAHRPETGIVSEPVLLFCKRVIHIESGKNLGYLLFSIRESKISDLFTNTDQHYYLLNKEGRIVSSTEKGEIFTELDNNLAGIVQNCNEGNTVLSLGEEALFTWVQIESFGYTLINQIALADLTDNIRFNTFLILLVFFLTIINVICLITFFTRTVTKPLEYLTDKIKRVEKGELTTKSYLIRKDELGDISNNFNRMVEEVVNLTESIKIEHIQKRKYELSLIQAQINPHFFYNVLDLIYVLCFQNDAKGAGIVTKYLADYYRGFLSNGKELISIKEEFEIVKKYLLIQKYRYGDILHFELCLEPAIQNMSIPKLTLQPLVENALYHGIKEWENKGTIIVSANRRGNYVFLRVSDNGKGMDEKKVKRLLQTEERSDHFGLKSVILRLGLYYNDKFCFKIFSKINHGTTVLLRIKEPITHPEDI